MRKIDTHTRYRRIRQALGRCLGLPWGWATPREQHGAGRDRFEEARGKAQLKWRSDELMAFLRD